MKTLPWRHLFAGALAAFFVLGGVLNIFPSPVIVAEYQRWGYPDWFHFVTGIVELSAAALIALPATRLAGSGLAALDMLAAATTVLWHGEYAHSIAPLIVLAASCLNGWLTWRGRTSSRG